MEEIRNKVAESHLININFKQLLQEKQPQVLDIADWLYEKLIVREEEFKKCVEQHNWGQYRGKTLVVYCSEDVIIPMWAWMLIANRVTAAGGKLIYSSTREIEEKKLLSIVDSLDVEEFRDKRILINGCQHPAVTPETYCLITQKLQPVARSLMYGEACSNIPIYKKK
jgi:hypothetical protein